MRKMQKRTELKEKKILTPLAKMDIIKASVPVENVSQIADDDKAVTDFFKKYKIQRFYNPITKNKTFFGCLAVGDVAGAVKIARINRLLRKEGDAVVLVKFYLNNGKAREFLVPENDGGFFYKDKKYIFDTKFRRENLDAGMFEYNFHEDFTLPFGVDFPSSEMKRTISKGLVGEEAREVDYATNPSTLHRFVNSKVIEMILHGGEIGDVINKVFWAVIIMGIIAILLGGLNGFFGFKIFEWILHHP